MCLYTQYIAYILDTYMIRFSTNDCFEDLLLGDSATLLYHSEYTALSTLSTNCRFICLIFYGVCPKF